MKRATFALLALVAGGQQQRLLLHRPAVLLGLSRTVCLRPRRTVAMTDAAVAAAAAPTAAATPAIPAADPAAATPMERTSAVPAEAAASRRHPAQGHPHAHQRRDSGGEYEFAAGPPTGATTYPYYTNRGPRDFLARNPRSIGP